MTNAPALRRARDKRATDFSADLSRLSECCVEGLPFLRCRVDDEFRGGRQRAGMRDGFIWRPDMEPRFGVLLET